MALYQMFLTAWLGSLMQWVARFKLQKWFKNIHSSPEEREESSHTSSSNTVGGGGEAIEDIASNELNLDKETEYKQLQLYLEVISYRIQHYDRPYTEIKKMLWDFEAALFTLESGGYQQAPGYPDAKRFSAKMTSVLIQTAQSATPDKKRVEHNYMKMYLRMLQRERNIVNHTR